MSGFLVAKEANGYSLPQYAPPFVPHKVSFESAAFKISSSLQKNLHKRLFFKFIFLIFTAQNSLDVLSGKHRQCFHVRQEVGEFKNQLNAEWHTEWPS